MSKNQIEYCATVTKDYFGPEVSKVVEYLVRNGSSPMRFICTKGNIPEDIVKKSLWILTQHNFVDFMSSPTGLPIYKVNINYVLQKNRHIKFIYMAKCMYGDEGKMIVEEIVRHGKANLDDVINSISNRSELSKEALREKLNQMKHDSLIIQCTDDNISNINDTKMSNNSSNTSNKRKNVIESDEEDEGGGEDQPAAKKLKYEGLWKLNEKKFNECLRNQVIIETVALKIDRNSADIVKAILRLSELSQPLKNNTSRFRTSGVTYNEIFNCLKKQASLSSVQLDQMMRILLEDASSIVMKDGESGGGIYKIDFQKAFTELCIAHITSVVQERYGSKSLRIFRVIMVKKKLEQKQIEELVMMDPKEAKELLYRLLEDNMITLTEVARTVDHAPQKTIFLFSVNLVSIAQMLLDRCYKATSNLIHRRVHGTLTNKRIIDKQKRLEIILAQIDVDDIEQRKELEEQMTPAEKEIVNNHRKMCDMLEKSEIQLDETIFVLESFLSFC